MPPKVKPWELRWPSLGVNRRMAQERVASAVSYPAAWASNCRLIDQIARRQRGGSRQGLTKLVSTDFGTTIADMIAIRVSSSEYGAEEYLVVLVDSKLTLMGQRLLVESGDYFLTEDGDYFLLEYPITASGAPATGFLLVGKQYVFIVTSAGIMRYNPKTGALSVVSASAGNIPIGCGFGAIFGDRMFLAGGDNTIYTSRKGDYTDWDFSVDVSDVGRAQQFQLSGDNEVAQECTALIPHEDKYMLAATVRTLWGMRGDPGVGSLERISPDVGIIGSKAWCKAGNAIVFLAEDGLYQVAANGSGLTPLTEDRIPQDLRDIDTSTVTPMLGYDHDGKAIHIYLPTSSGGDTHWLFELDNGSFWPMRLQDDHQPVAICNFQGDLVLAGADGCIRKTTGDDDDGTAIQSHALVGPLRLGSSQEKGLIYTIHGIIGAGSGTVNWRIVIGETAEEACDNGKLAIEAFQAGNDYDSYVAASGQWSAGRSKTGWPRVRSAWAVIWLQSTAQWAFESTLLETTLWGRHR